MSYTISTDIFCDCCGTYWEHMVLSDKAERAEATRKAKERGWAIKRDPMFRRYMHVCPECVRKKGGDGGD